MSTNFPSSLDTYATLVDNTDDVLAAHANDRGDAIEALEAKVGVDSSAVTTSHDYRITQLRAGTGMTGSSQATAFIPTGATVPTNGLYLAAANSISLATNSTSRVNINSSGTGTWAASTDEQLRFVGSNGYIAFYNTANSTRSGYLQIPAAAQATLWVEAPQALTFGTNNTTRMTIAANGNLTLNAGASTHTINTNTSSTGLLVANGTNSDNSAVFAGPTRALRVRTGTVGATLDCTDYPITAFAPLTLGGSLVNLHIQDTTILSIAATGATTISNVNSGTIALQVTSTGSVPALHAQSSGEVFRLTTSTARGSGLNYLRFYDPTGATGYFGYPAANSNLYMWNNLNGSILFGVNDTNVVTISSDGYTTFAKAAHTTPYNIGNSSTAFTIDFRNSNVQTITMTGNVASGGWTLSNPLSGQTVNMLIAQDGTGSRTLGWPSSFKWPLGVAPTVSTAASAVDLLTLTYHSSTGHYYATLLKGFA
jgi:hypothetical protein